MSAHSPVRERGLDLSRATALAAELLVRQGNIQLGLPDAEVDILGNRSESFGFDVEAILSGCHGFRKLEAPLGIGCGEREIVVEGDFPTAGFQ